jgi:hypothetical protein
LVEDGVIDHGRIVANKNQTVLEKIEVSGNCDVTVQQVVSFQNVPLVFRWG